MGAIIWPVDAVAGAPSYTGRTLRQTLAPLVGGATVARPLGGFSGVRPGTASSIVTATSTVWTVTPFAGVIDKQSAAISGPYAFAFDTNQTGSVTAANASNPRVDILYVQVSDPAEGDGTAVPGIAVGYLAGTAAASPVAPATPARSFVLAQINVPVSGGGSPSVSWKAPYVVAAGGILPVADATVRGTLSPAAGDTIFRVDTKRVETYNGSAWAAIASPGVVLNFVQSIADTTATNLAALGSTISLPAVPVASRVMLRIIGLIGFSGTANSSYGINVTTTGAGVTVSDSVGNTGVFCATAAQWFAYGREMWVDVPASIAATISFSMSTTSTAGHFKGHVAARVLLAGEY